MKATICILFSLLILLAASPARAHHAFAAEFDATDGHAFQHLAAVMTGSTQKDYADMMLRGGRSVEGNRSRSGAGKPKSKSPAKPKPTARSKGKGKQRG